MNTYTNEKVSAIAGPEFGAKQGSAVIIKKALCGLKTSAERWHAHLADTCRSMGRYDNDVWIRKSQDRIHYEYICAHVDDLMIISKQN